MNQDWNQRGNAYEATTQPNNNSSSSFDLSEESLAKDLIHLTQCQNKLINRLIKHHLQNNQEFEEPSQTQKMKKMKSGNQQVANIQKYSRQQIKKNQQKIKFTKGQKNKKHKNKKLRNKIIVSHYQRDPTQNSFSSQSLYPYSNFKNRYQKIHDKQQEIFERNRVVKIIANKMIIFFKKKSIERDQALEQMGLSFQQWQDIISRIEQKIKGFRTLKLLWFKEDFKYAKILRILSYIYLHLTSYRCQDQRIVLFYRSFLLKTLQNSKDDKSDDSL